MYTYPALQCDRLLQTAEIYVSIMINVCVTMWTDKPASFDTLSEFKQQEKNDAMTYAPANDI